jgi:hypothetical protein
MHLHDDSHKSGRNVWEARAMYITHLMVFVGFVTKSNSSMHVHGLYKIKYFSFCGPGSSVGIATGYGLDGPGIKSRLGARFSAPVQTGPEAHPAFCTMRTESLPGVKSGRRVTLTPHPLLVPLVIKE